MSIRRSGIRNSKVLRVFVLFSLLVLAAPHARADRYDDQQAGHPLRIVAYVFHPVGVILDYLILRPAHWIGSQKGLKTLFGHED